MKEINKNVYKEASYGKKHLFIVSLVLLAISLALLAGGITLVVFGCKAEVTAQIVWKVIVGVILILIALGLGSLSLTMLFTSLSMITPENGSVKDGNRAIGTVNVLKCDKCGEELSDNSTFCTKCGAPVEGVKMCECGEVNRIEDKFCKKCGKSLGE